MSKTIVLAVDTARRELAGHVAAAVEMTKDVARADDKVARGRELTPGGIVRRVAVITPTSDVTASPRKRRVSRVQGR